MDKEIRSVQIVTKTGAGIRYEVGRDGVTNIDVFKEQIGPYEYRQIYRIFKNTDLYAFITYNCPVEVIYKPL